MMTPQQAREISSKPDIKTWLQKAHDDIEKQALAGWYQAKIHLPPPLVVAVMNQLIEEGYNIVERESSSLYVDWSSPRS